MKISATVREHIQQLAPALQRHAMEYVDRAEASGPYAPGRFQETVLYQDALIFAQYMVGALPSQETPK